MATSSNSKANKKTASGQAAPIIDIKSRLARKLTSAAATMLADVERSVKSDPTGAATRMQLVPLSPDQIRARTKPKKSGRDGILSGGGYEIPYFDVNGKLTGFCRLRLFAATNRTEPIKYWQKEGTSPRVYYPPGREWAKIVRDTDIELIAVEGEKKAYRGTLEKGLNVLGLGGVWSFQSKRLGLTLVRDIEAIGWMGRIVYVCYDSDAADNEQVMLAESVFAEELARRGAIVKIIRLTPTSDGDKRGLDDFLEQEGRDAFDKLIETAEPYVDQFAELNRDCAVLKETGDILMLESGIVYSYSKFKKVIGAIYSEIVMTKTGRKIVSFVDPWLATRTKTMIDAMGFEPERYDPALPPYYVGDDGKSYYNRYSGLSLKPEAGDVSPWLDLFNHVFSTASEAHRNYVLDMLAFKAQRPGDRLNLSLVIIGGQGIGKSLLLETYGMCYGRYYSEVTNRGLHMPYNEWLSDKLVILLTLA
jgi:Domain of unknown function (DUF3854)